MKEMIDRLSVIQAVNKLRHEMGLVSVDAVKNAVLSIPAEFSVFERQTAPVAMACSGCDRDGHGDPLCGCCMRGGHGQTVDFYRPKGRP